jgi:hypothetical protein
MWYFDLLKTNPDEYFGWYYLLTQRHYLFDCIESGELGKASFEKYKTIILPDVQKLDRDTAGKLDRFVKSGGTLIVTGESAQYDERGLRLQTLHLQSLGVRRIGYIGRDILSAYFLLEDKTGFPRFAKTEYVYLHDTYCYADYAETAKKYLRLIPPHRHSPAEDAYHTNITDFPAFTVNAYGKGRGVYLPWKPGQDYYNLGFPNMDLFMSDLVENVLGIKPVGGNLPPMVEVEYTRRSDGGASYVHLVNGTGYFCGSYFEPVSLAGLYAELPAPQPAPQRVISMVTGKECKYEIEGGAMRIYIDRLKLFEAVKIV